MKKILTLALIFAMTLCLISCGSTDSEATTSQESDLTSEETYVGTYSGIGLYADGQYLLDDYFSSWITTLNADGSGYIEWDETAGNISAWSVKDGKITIEAGVSEIEGSLSDGVLLLELDDGYVFASVIEGFDTGTLNTVSLDDYMSGNSEDSDTAAGDGQELAAPVMEWWELYCPNGYDTLSAAINNPNDVAVDVSYDLVFYKNGAEVSRIEYCDNCSILPGHKDIIWANVDVPSAADADDVKMENVIVTEAYDTPIDGTYEYAGIIDGEACFDFTFDTKPTLATIWFVQYNDYNENDRFDQGEMVITTWANLTEQTGRVSYDTAVHSSTDCEIFFTAY